MKTVVHTQNDSAVDSPATADHPRAHMLGMLIDDLSQRRLVEGVAEQLGLISTVLGLTDIEPSRLFQFEILLADERLARQIQPALKAYQRTTSEIKPALIALVHTTAPADDLASAAAEFEGQLVLPEKPALLAGQLSVALYAHRAFARQYESAMQELRLNRNIFKSVTSGISVANAQLPDMPLTYVNPAFEVMTGYCLEEVEGRNCRFLQKGHTDQPGLTLIREAIASKRETVAVIRNYRKDGSPFWNELLLSPIYNRNGDLTHFVGIQNDVTERIEFETALRESEKLAAVGRLASAIAHEINNPLEAVMNLIYLVQTTEDATEARQYLVQADREVQRIKLITSQSLRFYKQSTAPQAVTCSDLLSSILDLFGPRLTNFGIELETRIRTDRHIVCLESEIRQVLSNLITNGIDAMKAAGGRLLIRGREATDWSSGSNGILITVADTGTGMSSETLGNMYKAFYTTKGDAGTGLGLWITQEIVQKHQGRLGVRSSQSAESSGTVFQLFLPFHPASEKDSDAGPVPQRTSLDASPSPG